MDKPHQAMLADGEPDVPFMLSWANEPWTVRWDGNAFAGDEAGMLLARERNPRASTVHHRGALVSWDNAPRHAQDGSSESTIWVHPELWKRMLPSPVCLTSWIRIGPSQYEPKTIYILTYSATQKA